METLKTMDVITAEQIAHIINSSIEKGKWPNAFKKAEIKRIQKAGDKKKFFKE